MRDRSNGRTFGGVDKVSELLMRALWIAGKERRRPREIFCPPVQWTGNWLARQEGPVPEISKVKSERLTNDYGAHSCAASRARGISPRYAKASRRPKWGTAMGLHQKSEAGLEKSSMPSANTIGRHLVPALSLSCRLSAHLADGRATCSAIWRPA
jgi:hypothetical protein